MNGNNPLKKLPLGKKAGDRIQAEDFNTVSLGIKTLYDSIIFSQALFGKPLLDVRAAITARGLSIGQILTVNGNEISPEDSSPDINQLKVLSVLWTDPGENTVHVITAAEPEVRIITSNFVGMNITNAREMINKMLKGRIPEAILTTPNFQGSILKDVPSKLTKLI